MESLATIGAPINIQLLDSTVLLMQRDPAATNARQIIEIFAQRPDSWTVANSVLNSDCSSDTKFIILGVLERTIRTFWPSFDQSTKNSLLHFILPQTVKMAQENSPEHCLNKTNRVVIEILKYEWPKNYPNFITDLLQSLSISAEVCSNGMKILKELSMDIIDYINCGITSARSIEMSDAFEAEFPKVFEAVSSILTNTVDINVVHSILVAIKSFVPLADVRFFIATPLFSVLCNNFISNPEFAIDVVDIFGEIGLSSLNDVPREFSQMVPIIFRSVIGGLKTVIKDENSFSALSPHFIEIFTNSLTSYLNSRFAYVIIDMDGGNWARLAIEWLTRVTEIAEDEPFRTCAEFWMAVTRRVNNDVHMNHDLSSLQLYGPSFSRLTQILVDKFVQPFDIVEREEDEDGFVWREVVETASPVYIPLKTTLVFLANINSDEVFSCLLSKISSSYHDITCLIRFSWAAACLTSEACDEFIRKAFEIIMTLISLPPILSFLSASSSSTLPSLLSSFTPSTDQSSIASSIGLALLSTPVETLLSTTPLTYVSTYLWFAANQTRFMLNRPPFLFNTVQRALQLFQEKPWTRFFAAFTIERIFADEKIRVAFITKRFTDFFFEFVSSSGDLIESLIGPTSCLILTFFSIVPLETIVGKYSLTNNNNNNINNGNYNNNNSNYFISNENPMNTIVYANENTNILVSYILRIVDEQWRLLSADPSSDPISITRIMKVYGKAASVLGPFFAPKMMELLPSFIAVHEFYSTSSFAYENNNIIKYNYDGDGDDDNNNNSEGRTLVSCVKTSIILAIEKFVKRLIVCPTEVAEFVISQCLQMVGSYASISSSLLASLSSYSSSNSFSSSSSSSFPLMIKDKRDPILLRLFGLFLENHGNMFSANNLSELFGSLYAPTVSIILADREENLPLHLDSSRLCLIAFLRGVVRGCIEFFVGQNSIGGLIETIRFLACHHVNEICQQSIQLLADFVEAVRTRTSSPQFADLFAKEHALQLIIEDMRLITDTHHNFAFNEACELLIELLSLPTVQLNLSYFAEGIRESLLPQISGEQIFELLSALAQARESKLAFRQLLRDFMIDMKKVSKNDPNLLKDEIKLERLKIEEQLQREMQLNNFS